MDRRPEFSLDRLAALISPAADSLLEQMAVRATALTRQRFGNAISLFAPLYLSNYCVNRCRYCGFNAGGRHNRRRLSLDEAWTEAKTIAGEGFRDILLVSSEDPQHISIDYLCRLAERLRRDNLFSSVGIEINVLSEAEYRRLFEAGIDAVTIFQETYCAETYRAWHDGGPKAVFEHRILAQEDAARAGMRRLGLGVLLGLEDWRYDTLAMALHADSLMRGYWRSRVSFSFPRIRPAEEVEAKQFKRLVSDRELVKMMLALRLCFPDAGVTLSTRESPAFRDRLFPLVVTQASAGSKTNPGGYTDDDATAQFDVADERSAGEIADLLAGMGFDPVWKDWDAAFHAAGAEG